MPKEYALLFGLWTAFVEVIPYIGPWLSAVPPAIYAIFVHPISIVWVALLFLFIYQIEGHVVVPNVMANALRLNPLLVIFGLLAGGELYGIAGVLVALPTMAGCARPGTSSGPGSSSRAGATGTPTCRSRSTSSRREGERPRAASGSG